MKRMKLGVLGASRHFITKVLPPLLKSELIEVYGIASRDPAKAEETAKQFGIPKSFSSYEELVQEKDLEMVYIPLPNHLHTEWIKKSADSGKHVVCEKPLALNAAEAKEALDYAGKKGIKVMEAFMYKFHPQWQSALEIVRFGEIGRINSIHTFFGYANNDPQNIRNIKETGGGALYDIGCYAVSSARFLLQAEPVKVLSIAAFDQAFHTDILTSGILDFGEGVRALFTIGTQTFPAQKVEVFGSGGLLTIKIPFNMYPDVPAKIKVTTDVGSRSLELGPCDQYRVEFEEFVRAVRGEAEVPNSPEDAVNNLKVLDALFRSIETGRWENV